LRFTDAILDLLEELRDFPNRGTMRDDLLPGLRTVGFRRRVTIAFVVEPTQVLVVGIFYGGQDFEAMLRDD
jgi:plasmid stabilization system protein ParE